MKDDPELTTNTTEAEENEKNLESFNEESLIETQEVIIRVRLELTELPYYCYSGKFEKLHKMNSTKAINKDNFRNYGKFRRIKMAEEILFEDTDCTKLFITLENEDELKSLEEDYGIVLYRGKEDVYGVTNVDTGALGIVGSRDDAGITLSTTEISDQDGILLNRAIHIFDVIPEKGDDSDGGVKTRVLLGKIPNEEKYGSIKNKNGLYAENVLVKGSLATQTVSSYSGISSDATTIPLYRGAEGLEVNEKPIFWVASWNEDTLEHFKSHLTNLVNHYHGLEEDNYIFDTKNNRWKTNEEVKSNIAANVDDQTELIEISIGAIFVKNLL
jgi:hypothetical protein